MCGVVDSVVMLVEGLLLLLQIPGADFGEVQSFEVCVGLQSEVGPGQMVGPSSPC